MAKSAEARAVDPKELKDAQEAQAGKDNQEGAAKKELPELSVGETMEIQIGENKVEFTLVANEDGKHTLKSEEGFVIVPENFVQIREKSAPTVADLQSTFDDQLEASLVAMGITEKADQEIYKQAAGAVKTLTLLDAVAAGDKSGEVITAKISELKKMKPKQLQEVIANRPKLSELNLAARKAQVDVDEAASLHDKTIADAKSLLASAAAYERSGAIREENRREFNADKARANAEGVVVPEFSAVYQEGADATQGRIDELDGQIRALEEKFDKNKGYLSAAETMKLNAFITEKKKHQIVLPMLRNVEKLSAALAETEEKAESQIAEQTHEIEDRLDQIDRSKWSMGMHLKRAAKRLPDPTGWAAHYGEQLGFGMDDWDDDDADEQATVMDQTGGYLDTLNELSEEAAELGERGILLDFSVEQEEAAAKTELQDQLLDMANDGSEEGVREFIDFMLGQESTSEAQKDVLKQTLDILDGKEVEGYIKETEEDEAETGAEGVAEAAVEAEDDDMEEWFAEEEVAVDSAVIDAAAAELGMSVEQLDGIKAWYEMVKGGIAMDEAKSGGGTSMETFGMPNTWNDFLQLGTSEKGLKGFFKKMLGGQSDMKKAFDALKNAPMDLGDIRLRKDSPAFGRFQDLKDRANKAPSHVFTVKIG